MRSPRVSLPASPHAMLSSKNKKERRREQSQTAAIILAPCPPLPLNIIIIRVIKRKITRWMEKGWRQAARCTPSNLWPWGQVIPQILKVIYCMCLSGAPRMLCCTAPQVKQSGQLCVARGNGLWDYGLLRPARRVQPCTASLMPQRLHHGAAVSRRNDRIFYLHMQLLGNPLWWHDRPLSNLLSRRHV